MRHIYYFIFSSQSFAVFLFNAHWQPTWTPNNFKILLQLFACSNFINPNIIILTICLLHLAQSTILQRVYFKIFWYSTPKTVNLEIIQYQIAFQIFQHCIDKKLCHYSNTLITYNNIILQQLSLQLNEFLLLH
ncbi:unnamed protein product [Paramecium octaurelia]|uniref:Transmembrane protein n=1 Tax=Paramecium octaurelia TaxID=43137 RepID=A0A8S1SJD8_PAROT|nr:unnamed protein product [Paramecium octaurelia]